MLRSIRYGEADRILHLYTPGHGRIAAIAKGARRSRSRFGARLEPFFQIRVVLHEGRGELYTVTGVETIDARPGLRESAQALDGAARACDAVARLFETDEPHPEVFTLLANELTVLAERAAAIGGAEPPATANALAFRLKLLLAAGIVPQLGSCASCGEREHLTALLGGLRAASSAAPASRPAFPLEEEAYEFMVDALGRPLAQCAAGPGAGAAPGRAGDHGDRRASRARAPAACGAVRIAAVSDTDPAATRRPRPQIRVRIPTARSPSASRSA